VIGARAIFDRPMARRWRENGAKIFRQLPQKGRRGLSTPDAACGLTSDFMALDDPR
jgi:hypothetical protein